MASEAFQLRQKVKNCRRQAKVLVITSGKGGDGKINIAANPAAYLAASVGGKESLFKKVADWFS